MATGDKDGGLAMLCSDSGVGPFIKVAGWTLHGAVGTWYERWYERMRSYQMLSCALVALLHLPLDHPYLLIVLISIYLLVIFSMFSPFSCGNKIKIGFWNPLHSLVISTISEGISRFL